jgi:hydroxymethylbilane synthase
MPRTITLGTRSSGLAIRQTDLVLEALRESFPNAVFAVESIHSEGDRKPDIPLAQLSKGTFVTELERALFEHRIDLAVHSLKDLPTEESLHFAVMPILKRADPRDVLINRWDLPFAQLLAGARIGTSSPRREALLRSLRSDLHYLPIRGNVETRLVKASGQDYDGVVLAAAGIERLGIAAHVAEYFDIEACTPAPGQGALAAQVRSADTELTAMVQSLTDADTSAAVEAERWVLRAAGGGCQVPIGALAVIEGNRVRLTAATSALDGSTSYRTTVAWDANDSEGAGRAAYAALLASRRLDEPS